MSMGLHGGLKVVLGGGRVDVDEVRVGEVVVRLSGEKGKEDVGEGEVVVRENGGTKVVVRAHGGATARSNSAKQPIAKKLVRMYRSKVDELTWARKGMVATVINGEVVPLVQSRIDDAGFKDNDIISMGADKVFIHSLSDTNITNIVGDA